MGAVSWKADAARSPQAAPFWGSQSTCSNFQRTNPNHRASAFSRKTTDSSPACEPRLPRQPIDLSQPWELVVNRRKVEVRVLLGCQDDPCNPLLHITPGECCSSEGCRFES